MSDLGIIYQIAIPDLATDQVAGGIRAKCRAMLIEEPLTRTDYWIAYIRYLARYHDLDRLLRLKIHSAQALIDYLNSHGIPCFRDVANRCQELMRADADLKPPAAITNLRQKQRRQKRR